MKNNIDGIITKEVLPFVAGLMHLERTLAVRALGVIDAKFAIRFDFDVKLFIPSVKKKLECLF